MVFDPRRGTDFAAAGYRHLRDNGAGPKHPLAAGGAGQPIW